MESLAQLVDGGAIYSFVTSHAWVWPLLETVHFIGLSLLLGALIIIDLRLMGFFRGVDIRATHSMLPWVFVGFSLNLITGVLFFFGDPFRYAGHTGFQIKMALVVLAGINAAWYYWKLHPVMNTWDPEGDTPALAKTIAFVSLTTWTGVLILGRLIPYMSTG